MSVDSFPLAWPTTKFIESTWKIDRRQVMGVTGGPRDIAIDFGQPAWTATLKTIPLFDVQCGAWDGFRAALRGQARFFCGWDPRREYPVAYMPAGWGSLTRSGGGAFDGWVDVPAIGNSGLDGVGRDLISLGRPRGLPVGFSLQAGDMLSLRQGVDLLAADGDLGNSAWGKVNCSLTANAATAPDGTATAGVMTRTATGNEYVTQSVTMAAAAKWFRFGIWLRLGSLTLGVGISFSDALGAHAVSVGAAVTTSWQYFEVSGQMDPAAAGNIQVELNPINSTGSAGDTLYIWRPRLTRIDAEKYSLHRVLGSSAVVADSSGAATLWVEPEVPASFVAGVAQANLYRACAKMRVTACDIPISAAGRNRPGQATITAVSTSL